MTQPPTLPPDFRYSLGDGWTVGQVNLIGQALTQIALNAIDGAERTVVMRRLQELVTAQEQAAMQGKQAIDAATESVSKRKPRASNNQSQRPDGRENGARDQSSGPENRLAAQGH